MTALIFDLDGTLVDSAPDIHAGVNQLLEQEGIAPLPFAVVRGFIGGGVPILISRVMRATGMEDDPQRHATLCARFIERYERDPGGLTRPYAGVEAALAALDRPLALCTNKPEGPTRALLAQLGWSGLFSVIVAGDTLPVRKPDPAPLLHGISLLGGGPVLFVGDSEVDAETAERAGVPLLLFTEGYCKTPVAELPHRAAFADWAAFPDLVRSVIPA
ncbi:phosphoglycolate phosphatase [Tabrizicola sp. TH137]|uniref:phosphoglycolate phosphatase n=1 Tax=Tabrizicola sp. TH137 TaxID=2067452 RepID=UPI000C79F4FE|nr:phosphoglycolate phosphatase [Tabrizicola sp. TH137]PLL12969.1 phosphoglycolate phosphatase [Tabrizicola sp. TH137]